MDSIVSSPTTPRIRRDAWSADRGTTDEVGWFALAVAAMRARPGDDPGSWTAVAAAHGRHAAHASWSFLPWHRRWLCHVEGIARDAVRDAGGPSDWALPYWAPGRSARDGAIPRAFRGPRRGDGSANPLYAVRGPGVDDGAGPSPRHASAEPALGLIDFTGPPTTCFGGPRPDPERFARFRGELERHHDIVRGLTGGSGPMGTTATAAQDPLHWLLMAGIDRLWDRWLARGGGRANPRDPRWPGAPSLDPADSLRPADSLSPIDLGDPCALGYRYDDALPVAVRARRLRSAVARPRPGPPVGPVHRLGASDQGLRLEGPGSAVIRLDPAGARRVEEILDDPAGGRRVLLSLDHVEAPAPPGVVYDLHLGPEPDESTYAGTLGFGDARTAAVDEAFDVTGLLDLMRRQGRWRPGDTTVTAVPAGPGHPGDPGDPGHTGVVVLAPATVAQISVRSG